nr:hypothetical protein [Tanacetum cinerariifolium]
VWSSFGDDRHVCLWLSDIELLLVAFDSQLKVFYPFKNDNSSGKEYPFDLSKPLPLIMIQGRQVVPVDYFINNDLEYLRGESSSKIYTTSIRKTKAANYDIPSIEDMVPS